MIVARIVDPRSKLATARALTPESTVSTLGQMLNLGGVDENELYAAMDWLVRRQRGIEKRLAQRHLHDNTLLLYDLTSSYFEGHTCPLARRGHSRDGKRGTLQIVFGLLCTADGCPIAVEVFEGSTGDPKTVAAQVDKIRHRFGLQRVVLVGDRGMLTGARIREDLKGHDGLRWITTLRAPTIRKLIKAGKVAQTMFDERDLAEISSPEFPGERLIVCRNPVLADQRHRKRQELLAATEKDLLPIVKATQRAKEPLRGAAAIGVRVGKVINGRKMGKHFITTITDDSFSFARDTGADRGRGRTGRALHRALQRGAGAVRRRADGDGIQGPGQGGARFPQYEDGGSEGAPNLPSDRRPGPGARVPVHAGLLRGVAHAQQAGAGAVRRP